MPHSNDTSFTPEAVDQQIDHYLSGQHDTPTEHAAHQTIMQFKHIYGYDPDEQVPSLERVWQRVLAAEAQESAASTTTASTDEPEALLPEILPMTNSNRPWKKRRRARHLIVGWAAAFCLVLIVGSFVWIAKYSHPGLPTSTATVNSASGLYAYQDQTAYRLDSQTHQILWRHTFANERVEDNTMAGGSTTRQPFAVGGNLYVTTRSQPHPDQQYLYALSITNGSVLWRLSITSWALANDEVVYTVSESQTSDISTLTAYNAQNGKQLWQHQYNIPGTKGRLNRGTPYTDGFRLLAVNDQVLYAVTDYQLQGKDLFARYGLSPKDGSIMWQNSEPIVGDMTEADARVVNGVIYTSEFNPTFQDIINGGVHTTLVQSRVAAYAGVSGQKLWQTPQLTGEETRDGFAPIISGNLLYYQTQSTGYPFVSTLHALNIKDGSQLWKYQMNSDKGTMSVVILDGNSVYFEANQLIGSTSSQHVIALNAQTGNIRWSTPVQFQDGTESTPTPVPHKPGQGIGAPSEGIDLDIPLVINDGTLYYSVAGNRVYMLRPSDGKVLSQFWVDRTKQTVVLNRMILFSTP